jgi:translocation and assembly module TamB
LAAGTADVDFSLKGTVGEPSLTTRVALVEARYGEYGPYQLEAELDAPGTSAKLDAAIASQGTRGVELTLSAPLDLDRFLREPERGARALLDARLSGEANVPEFDLSRFAGDFGLPADLAGRVRGGADIEGTLRAPRGSLGLEGSDVAVFGYEAGAAQLALLLTDDATGVAGSVSVAGEEILQASGFLELPVERLVATGRIESAPLLIDLIVPDADLSRAGGEVPLAGHIDARLRATGSLQQPEVDLAVDGKDVFISGKPLGQIVAKARAAGMTLSADATVQAASGGTLTASLRSTAEVSLASVRRGDLASAPSELSIVADRVGLGVLAALLPGTVRSASGELGADLAAKGPLTSLRPNGQVRVSNGQVAVAELGEWSGIQVDAALTAETFKVERLQATRGRGTLDATAEARGLGGIGGADSTPAEFTASLRTRSLTIPRAGQDLATLDLQASAKGSFDAKRLQAEVTIPRGTVELPERGPRDVQSLEKRDDIVIVSSLDRGVEPREGAGDEEEAEDPYRATVRVVVPNRFFITSVNPRMNIELQADATFDVIGSAAYAEGTVEVLRGSVEPIGGRDFTIERGRITFTGAAPQDAVLDIVAEYENPSADVTVAITGTTKEPVVKMTSEPPMDEAQIAMLIATGRTELKAGSGGVGTLTGEEAGRAALGAVATQLFRNVVADRLPVDSVALSSSEIRAGKYVTDKIYVGYTRNFEAQPEQGENTNELRVEYQISPRWTLESRYGDARTGGASIIWSKDY